MVQVQVKTDMRCTIKNANNWKGFITQKAQKLFTQKPILLVISAKHARYIREILYIHLGKWNVLSFAHYSHELVISVFVITKFYCINLNVGYDNKPTEEVETSKFLGLQIDNNLNWKAHWIYCAQTTFSMLFHEDSHTTLENTHFKISLLCLFPFHYVIWSYLLGKFNIQQKSI
jgi:hypothetical protein